MKRNLQSRVKNGRANTDNQENEGLFGYTNQKVAFCTSNIVVTFMNTVDLAILLLMPTTEKT